MKVIEGLWQKKKGLEKNLKNRPFDGNNLFELQNLIGKSNIFKKPENYYKSQSLRHYVYKSKKSVDLLGKNMAIFWNNINANADQKLAVDKLTADGINVRQAVKSVIDLSRNSVDLFQVLDGILINEAECLAAMEPTQKILSETGIGNITRKDAELLWNHNLNKYVVLVADEESCMNQISKLMSNYSTQMGQLLDSVNKYIREKNLKKRNDALDNIIFFLATGVGIAFAVSFGVHANATGWGNLEPNKTTTAIALVEAGILILRRIILTNFPSAASKSMMNSMQQLTLVLS